MDYGRAPLADRLAAEYVLGTLRGGALRRFESLLPAHPALRAAVAQWQDALMPLAASVKPVAPSNAVWQGVESRLFGSPSAATELPWWQRLLPWRLATGTAGLAALVLGVALMLPVPPQPPVLVVLSPSGAADPAAPSLTAARFVASVSPDGRGLVLRPLDTLALTPAQALELWAVPGQGAPRSLGLVSSQQATTVLRASLLADTAAFAISVEPPGGSKTGAPSGPIISVGKLES